MPEIVVCFLSFLVVVAVVFWFVHLFRTSSSSKLAAVREGLEAFRNAKSQSERFLVVFWYSVLILAAGLATILLTSIGVLASAAMSICGPNPWPYISDMFHRLMDVVFGPAESTVVP